MLHDFTVTNFRGFKNLSLQKLGRVNLIVGKNSVGKSSLLEALRLYASNGTPGVLWDSVTARDEHRSGRRAIQALVGLFHNRSEIRAGIQIGPRGDKLTISIEFRGPSPTEDGTVQYILFDKPEGDEVVPTQIALLVKSETMQRSFPLTRDFESYLRIATVYRPEPRGPDTLPKLPAVFVTANGLTPERQAELWDDVALSSLEDDVTTSLRLIVPKLDRVSLIGSKDDRGRSPFGKLADSESPIPLKRLGDGVARIFGMALALVNSQGGLLLVDEIENGIHHSVQESLWRFILDVSRRLNVQVFATSHSWDCLAAFQKAASECQPEEGILTRLEEVDGSIQASQFDEMELKIAAKDHIEIR